MERTSLQNNVAKQKLFGKFAKSIKSIAKSRKCRQVSLLCSTFKICEGCREYVNMPTKVSSVLILFLENIPFLMLFMKSKMQTFYLKLGIEGLMFLAAVASLMVPLIIGIVVLDPASFMHRLFLSLFNIRLRLELKILPLIFLIVFFNLQVSPRYFLHM